MSTSHGFRIHPAPPAPLPGAVQALSGLSVSHLSDVLLRTRTTGALRLYSRPNGRMCGPAVTVRVAVGDHLMVQKALDLALPGQVIVVDAQGWLESAMVGEVMTRLANLRGLGGFVIDGAIRDIDHISGQDLPVYARGVTPRGPTRRGPGEIHVPVQVGGMIVEPGDIVCGDLDGLVSVSPANLHRVVDEVHGLREKEERAIAAMQTRTLDRAWVDDALRANGLHEIR